MTKYEHVKPYTPQYNTMLPYNYMRSFRHCVLWHIFRFVVLNLWILRVIHVKEEN